MKDIKMLIEVYEEVLKVIDANIANPKSEEILNNLRGRKAVYNLVIEDLKGLLIEVK